MTDIHDVLQWPAGLGWIVLSGGKVPGSVIRAQVLRRGNENGGVAYIGLTETTTDATLDDMEDLGAPTGYLVNVTTEDDDTIREQIKDASIVVVDASETADDLRNSLLGAGVDGIRLAYEKGAVIFFEGTSASLLGEYVPSNEAGFRKGLSWLENTLILSDVTSLRDSPEAQRLLDAKTDAVVIGVGLGSALVLGPGGLIEIWGKREVTIALGRDFSQ